MTFSHSWIPFSSSKWARHAWNDISIGLVAGPLDVRHKWKVFEDASWDTVAAIVPVLNQPHELYAFYGGHYFRAKFDPDDELKTSFVYQKNTIENTWALLYKAGLNRIDVPSWILRIEVKSPRME